MAHGSGGAVKGCDWCEAPATHSIAWRTGRMTAPAFDYACPAHLAQYRDEYGPALVAVRALS